MQLLGVLMWGLAVSLGAIKRELPEGAVEILAGQEEGGSQPRLRPETTLTEATLPGILETRY